MIYLNYDLPIPFVYRREIMVDQNTLDIENYLFERSVRLHGLVAESVERRRTGEAYSGSHIDLLFLNMPESKL